MILNMIKKKIINGINMLTAAFLLFVILLFYGESASVNRFFSTQGLVPFISLLFSVLCIIFYMSANKFRLSGKYFGTVLLFSTLIPRLVWIFTTEIPTVSDFDLYHKTAVELLHGDVLQKGYIAIFPHVLGYPYVLSLLYRLFGPQVVVAQLFNAFCSCLTALMIWRIAGTLLPEKTAKISALFCGVWVSQIFFSSIVSTEALFTCQFTFCVLLLTEAWKQTNFYVKAGLFFLMGLFAAWANAVRPLAPIFLVVAMTCIFLERWQVKFLFFKKMVLTLIMVLSFSLFFHINTVMIEKVIQREPAKNSFGYTFLVGSNISSNGGWNKEDAEYLFSLYNSGEYSLGEINGILTRRAVGRIVSDLPHQIIHYITKNTNIWLNDSYGIEWNKLSVEVAQKGDWNAPYGSAFVFLSNVFYQTMVLLSFAGLAIAIATHSQNRTIFPFNLLLLGFASAHMLSEVQGRYHYAALPFLAVCSAYGVQTIATAMSFAVASGRQNRVDIGMFRTRRGRQAV